MNKAHKSECPGGAGQNAEQSINDLDFPTGQRQRKELFNLLNQLAMRGHLVIEGTQNDFHVCKYGFIQHCHDFGELHMFAVQLGVVHG